MLQTVFIILLCLLVADLVVVFLLNRVAAKLRRQVRSDKQKEREKLEKLEQEKKNAITVGRAHNIGARPSQQDSMGTTPVYQGQGILAVVADGMGGLSGGDQVSQRIVMDMLSMGAQNPMGQMDGILLQMVNRVNENVNAMLGPEGLYKSGSTLLGVLALKDRFQWISVGDSRIYLFRQGRMIQLNQEHNLLQDWMPQILEGKMNYAEALQNPDGKKLTSFIGMGQLKHVSSCTGSVPLQSGDRILLMSDGVFNTLPESAMEQILTRCPDVQNAAAVFEQQIKAAQAPGQDNFTVVILGV